MIDHRSSAAQTVGPPRIAIVGGGPAGLMAAEIAARGGARVTVYDRMAAPARKFLLAGRGGLNLTHSEPLPQFLKRYGNAADEIHASVRNFTAEQLISWANDLGQPTFVGTSGRVFPTSMKASPLLRAWLQRLGALGVDIKTRHTWNGFSGNTALQLIDAHGRTVTAAADATILALGGASWPRLGSDGSWVNILRSADIEVAPLSASNCGVKIAWSEFFAAKFAGQPLKRVGVQIGDVTRRGEAMITRAGLEGGIIYACGRDIRNALAKDGYATVVLDLKPDVPEVALAERLDRPRGSQSLANHLRKTVALDQPAIALIHEIGMPVGAAAIAHRIKHIPLTVTGLGGLDRAISTAGGIAFSGLDARLMLLQKPGVFVAGEMLDWDAPTGGYLLQACLSTGVTAANGALDWVRDRARQKAPDDGRSAADSRA